jgi:hypothetical protein
MFAPLIEVCIADKPTTSSSLSDHTINVYRADMQQEDYALISLLCGDDYNTVNIH